MSPLISLQLCFTGSIVEIIVTKENEVNGIFYQDEQMRLIVQLIPRSSVCGCNIQVE